MRDNKPTSRARRLINVACFTTVVVTLILIAAPWVAVAEIGFAVWAALLWTAGFIAAGVTAFIFFDTLDMPASG